jgi:hypothetical protein
MPSAAITPAQLTRGPDAGNACVRPGLQQRQQGERAFVQVRMRQAQAGLVDDGIAVEQQVEVEDARPPAFAFDANPAGITLDGKQDIEQVARRQRRVDQATALTKSGWSVTPQAGVR